LCFAIFNSVTTVLLSAMKLIKRIELNYLSDWRHRQSRQPLIIRGARQVGKSALVRQFVGQQLLYAGDAYQSP
jgi:predicted AAA+ superfamily ATPase